MTTLFTETKTYTLRDYQEESVTKGAYFFNHGEPKNEIHILPTAAGKSLCIAGVCEKTIGDILVLQPSKEILEQNYEKFISYGGHAGVYSASVGSKTIGRVTFATIGSVMNNIELFKHIKQVIIDECHFGVNPKGGQYVDLMFELGNPKILGFTATPFRLFPSMGDSILRFITRTRPSIFKKVGFFVQIQELKKRGYLADLEYFPIQKDFNRNLIELNTNKSDYNEKSLREYYKTTGFNNDVINVVRRINKKGRRVLAFVSFVEDALEISGQLEDSATVHGKTPAKERKQIADDFKSGKLKSVINVGCFTIGFDDPYLGAVVLAKPMRSLGVYYQMVGRGLRKPEDMPSKNTWVVDMCGNYGVFGKVEELTVSTDTKDLPCIRRGDGQQITNVLLSTFQDSGPKKKNKSRKFRKKSWRR